LGYIASLISLAKQGDLYDDGTVDKGHRWKTDPMLQISTMPTHSVITYHYEADCGVDDITWHLSIRREIPLIPDA
jgi:hypothetical protein